jgi:hypothetical protein
MYGMKGIDCTILRGGTSKGIYLLEKNLPQDPELRDRVILAIFGSPDKRQIDGLGGADPLTSKVAVVGPSNRPGIDIEYTFGQVGIEQRKVFYHSMCGNITSGVAPFAINNHLVRAVEGITKVHMYNRNTDKVIVSEVPVIQGKAAVEGDYVVAGVPGSGAKVTVDFSATVGALAGKGLLPTGNVRDVVNVKGVGEIEVSLVDASTCQVFIRAQDVGLTGKETPKEVDSNPELLQKLEAIRAHGAYIAGLAATEESAKTERRNTPHLVIVGEKSDYANHLTGETVKSEDIDILARMMFMQIMHKTYAGTGSICTAVATQIPGTIANEYFSQAHAAKGVVRIGHPAGIIDVEAIVAEKDNSMVVARAAIGRTARTIMEGKVYIRESVFTKNK